MELILISSDKLKVIMSSDDLKSFNLTADDLDYTKVSTKHFFWSIIDKAHEQTGFNADKSKLYVQVFPSNDGGCEIFIKRSDNTEHEGENTPKSKTKVVASQLKESFLVLGFKELCLLCSRMIEDDLRLHTSLYYDHSGKYILIVEKNKEIPSYIQSYAKYDIIPDYLSEYGEVFEYTDKAGTYINEHCKKLASGNAAEILSSL